MSDIGPRPELLDRLAAQNQIYEAAAEGGDRWQVMAYASHEVGHHLVAQALGFKSCPELNVQLPGGLYAPGVCGFVGPLTPFRDALISWAGILGQCIAGYSPLWLADIAIVRDNLPPWRARVFSNLKKLSTPDIEGIIAPGFEGSCEALAEAFEISNGQRAKLESLVRVLADDAAQPVTNGEPQP